MHAHPQTISAAVMVVDPLVAAPNTGARRRPIPARLLAVASAFTAAVLLLSSGASASCSGGWDLTGDWLIEQSNDTQFVVRLLQKEKQITGSAYRGGDPVVALTGSVQGDSFTFTVPWGRQNSVGEYNGHVDDRGNFGGTTFDKNHPETRAEWRAVSRNYEQTLAIAACRVADAMTPSSVPPAETLPPLLPPAEPPLKAQGRVKLPEGTGSPPISICEAAEQARLRNSPAAPGLEAQCNALIDDLVVASMDGPKELRSGLSGTFVVTIKNAGGKGGALVVPVELHIVFAGKLDQTGQIVAGAGLACEVVHDTGINAAVRCVGGQLPRGETTTVTVQGRSQPTAGAGMLIATLNASRSVAETNYDNNTKQLNVAIKAGPGLAAPAPPAPPTPQSPPMQVGICGPPGGMAVVVIPDPNLHTLNVRASPGGTVLTAIQEGSQVSIVGECGPEAAAGFTKPPAGTSVPSGWCQIDAPVAGCVSAKFLAFGGQAAGLVKTAPPAPAAVPAFTGSWDATAQDVAYTITLKQTVKSVTGSYEAADGSVGKITGKVKGNVLRFAWTQTDGISGSGKFALAEDGQSFAGSYTLGNNPDQADGSWSGSRR